MSKSKTSNKSVDEPNILSQRCYSQWKYSAKRRSIEWELDIEYLRQLFIEQGERCPVTHQKLFFVKNHTKDYKDQNASLDRINSKIGYVKGNVRFVSKWFNMLKNALSDEDLIDYCRRIILVHDYSKIIEGKNI